MKKNNKKKLKSYRFHENNSGGFYRISLKQYNALLKSGWYIAPNVTKDYTELTSDNVPFFYRYGLAFNTTSIKLAVKSWEKATGKDFFTKGCDCCGSPYRIGSIHEPYESIESHDAVKMVRPF